MAQKSDMAVYEPPKKGFPFLAVTVFKDEVAAVPVRSSKEARNYLSELRRRLDKSGKWRGTSN
jgi:hypothetical protein